MGRINGADVRVRGHLCFVRRGVRASVRVRHCRSYPKADDLTDGFWDKFPPLTDQAFRDHFQEGLQQYATLPRPHPAVCRS